MHPILGSISNELNALNSALASTIPANQPLNQLTGHWGCAGITLAGLQDRVSSVFDKIALSNLEFLDTASIEELSGMYTALQFLRGATVPHLVSTDANQAAPAFLITIQALDRAISKLAESNDKTAIDAAKSLRKAAIQIRGIESSLRNLSPKTSSLQTMLDRIEQAYEAADQLPADLELLSEARQKISSLSLDAEKDRLQISAAKEDLSGIEEEMKRLKADASAILIQCESVYSSATSVGLAAAFSERSKSLGSSMWFWVVGLIAALITGGIFGSMQLSTLVALISNPDKPSNPLVWINVSLAVLSVGGPIWFSWLATKQVGQRFRLSEDYAFKASVSRAYEGYRRETVKVDKQLEAKLLRSALDRLDEQPLRLIESSSYGSPWHEMLASDAVKTAAKSIPGFVDAVAKFAGDSLAKAKSKPLTLDPLSSVDSVNSLNSANAKENS